MFSETITNIGCGAVAPNVWLTVTANCGRFGVSSLSCSPSKRCRLLGDDQVVRASDAAAAGGAHETVERGEDQRLGYSRLCRCLPGRQWLAPLMSVTVSPAARLS